MGELSENSGVAKSIISQIERNETNPTLSTVVRLSRALDTTVDEVLRSEQQSPFIEHQSKSSVPMLESQDGLCRLAIVGPLSLVDVFQWYDFHAKEKGVLFGNLDGQPIVVKIPFSDNAASAEAITITTYTLAVRTNEGGWQSADGTRTYRPPTNKPNTPEAFNPTGSQANFKYTDPATGVTTNGHMVIK